jgi:hypothetical protein
MCPSDTGAPTLHRFVNVMSLGQIFYLATCAQVETKNPLLSKEQILQILIKSTRRPTFL